MKRKQEQEIRKLHEVENKSHLSLSRRNNPTPLAKFNTREAENAPIQL
jgi:hypothetical protein